MPDRSVELNVRFVRSFRIDGMQSTHPAGLYRLVRDEEEIVGLSFVAYRLLNLMIHTPAIATPGAMEVHKIRQADLDAALDLDQAQPQSAPGISLGFLLSQGGQP